MPVSEATITAMFESYREIAIAAHRDGKRVEFDERTERGGVVYLTARVSPRFESVEDSVEGSVGGGGARR